MRSPRRDHRRYALHGLVHCGVCDRRTEGTWAHDTARYRCQYPAQYALANGINHPKTVHVREDAILPPLDAWLAKILTTHRRTATLDALFAATEQGDDAPREAAVAQSKIVDCDRKLVRYRAALEAGAGPALVAEWLAEVQAGCFGLAQPPTGRVSTPSWASE